MTHLIGWGIVPSEKQIGWACTWKLLRYAESAAHLPWPSGPREGSWEEGVRKIDGRTGGGEERDREGHRERNIEERETERRERNREERERETERDREGERQRREREK